MSDGPAGAGPADPVGGPSDSAAAAVPKGRSELALRVASALVLAVLAIGTAWAGGWSFGLFWTIAAILVWREWIGILGHASRKEPLWAAGAVGIALAATFAEGGRLVRPEIALVLVLATLGAAMVAPRRRLVTSLGVLYAAVIAIVPIALRGHPGHGLTAILWIFAVVWLTDIGAYFAGRTIGGPKLWPRVSPKKTWSGFIGGITAGTLGAWAIASLASTAHGQAWYAGMGLMVLSLAAAVLSQGGDLLESAMKRHFGVKDSSQLIPGHGGVMDRLDSFWAVCMLMGLLLLASGAPAP